MPLCSLALCRIEQQYINTAIIEPPPFQQLLSETNKVIPTDLSGLLLPRVMLWHPLVQFPLLFQTLAVCPNEHCTGLLQFHEWVIGQSKGKQPRSIHDTKSIVLLIGAIYKCSENHVVYSTDPRYLKRIDRVHLPFVLLHRTGFTRTFIHCVISLAQEGLPIQAIVRHIKSIREECAAEMVINLITDCVVCTGQELVQEQTLSLAIYVNHNFFDCTTIPYQ